MKSTITAFILLFLLIIFSCMASSKQREILNPMAEKIDALPKSISEYKEENKKTYSDILSKCESEFEKKLFIIELGIPNEEYQRVHLSIKNALASLESNNTLLFLSYVNECDVYIGSLLDHCNTSVKNIL